VKPYYASGAHRIYHGDAREILPALLAEGVRGHVITDPPYSAKTHEGATAKGRVDNHANTEIAYAAWSPDDVGGFVSTAVQFGGWVVGMTDTQLIPAWQDAYIASGYTEFAPVPCVITGMTVRLAGDGPSSWAVYAMVARPKSLARWGTLPGAYVGGRGERAQSGTRIGGKPLWLMRAIVSDYSREGDVVIDPYMGGGTTLVATAERGRIAIGCEIEEEWCEKSARALEATIAQGRMF